MPLPDVGVRTKQCTARSKRSGKRCKNPAVVLWGYTVCRMHGARRSETVRRGKNHPGWKHGGETIEAKAERHMMSVFFHDAENLMFALGMTAPGSTRTRGRKPNISKGQPYASVTRGSTKGSSERPSNIGACNTASSPPNINPR